MIELRLDCVLGTNPRCKKFVEKKIPYVKWHFLQDINMKVYILTSHRDVQTREINESNRVLLGKNVEGEMKDRAIIARVKETFQLMARF